MPQTMLLPEHHEQLVALFRDETWCARYLFLLRWPNNFICPSCNRSNGPRSPAARITCHHCGRSISITTGTLLHGTKKPLSTWLHTIWLLCETHGNQTMKTWQRRLNITSYQTAWNWLRTIRLAMRLADQQKCSGTIEIDCGFVAFDKDSNRGRHLVAAVEVEPKNRLAGRIRMDHYPLLSTTLLSGFIERVVEPGSLLLAPDQDLFRALEIPDRIYLVEPGCPVQDHARAAIDRCRSSFTARKGPRQGAARLQDHLDEFCFRTNSALLANRRRVFELLLRSLLHHRPGGTCRKPLQPCTGGGLP